MDVHLPFAVVARFLEVADVLGAGRQVPRSLPKASTSSGEFDGESDDPARSLVEVD
jgi:hypothetical protein